MRKSLTVGIISLLILSAVAPIGLGLDIKESKVILEPLNYDAFSMYEIYGYNPVEDVEVEPNSKNIESKEIESYKHLIEPSDGPMDSPWPMYCHDARHTGRSPYSTDNNQGIEKWRIRMNNWIEGGPVLSNDGTIYFGCFDYFLHALYPNGTEKWKRNVGDWVWDSPAIAEDGTIYVGSENSRLYAINPDGSEKWSVGTGDSIFSSPVIAEDGTIYLGNFGKKIVAINPNGTIKWNYNTDDYISSCPAISNDSTIYIGSHDNYLYALYSNGTLRWKFKTGNKIYGSPSIADEGTIYIGCSWDSYLYALNPNGTLKWKYKDAGTPNNPSIASDGTIYCGYLDKLVALNPEGSLKWKFDIGDNRYIGTSSPAISADGTIYFGTHIGETQGGEIIAVNPDGTEKWKKKIANRWVESSPCIGDDGTIYIGSSSDNVNGMSYGYLHAFGPQESNYPPESPMIEGPTSGKINSKYTFTLLSTDPDRNPISYYVNWGDGTNSGWTEDVNTGESVTLSHTWKHVNTFTIRAKVRDTFGLESDETEFEFKLSNPRNITRWLEYLDMFPIIQRIFAFIK